MKWSTTRTGKSQITFFFMLYTWYAIRAAWGPVSPHAASSNAQTYHLLLCLKLRQYLYWTSLSHAPASVHLPHATAIAPPPDVRLGEKNNQSFCQETTLQQSLERNATLTFRLSNSHDPELMKWSFLIPLLGVSGGGHSLQSLNQRRVAVVEGRVPWIGVLRKIKKDG